MIDAHGMAILSQEVSIAIERGIENAVATIVNSREFQQLSTVEERFKAELFRASVALFISGRSGAHNSCVQEALRIWRQVKQETTQQDFAREGDNRPPPAA